MNIFKVGKTVIFLDNIACFHQREDSTEFVFAGTDGDGYDLILRGKESQQFQKYIDEILLAKFGVSDD